MLDSAGTEVRPGGEDDLPNDLRRRMPQCSKPGKCVTNFQMYIKWDRHETLKGFVDVKEVC